MFVDNPSVNTIVIECDRRESIRVRVDESEFDALRKLSWHGIPARYRSTVWKLLLGYSSPVTNRTDDTTARKRAEYWSLVRRYQGEGTRRDEDTYHQVSIDVPRTCPDEVLFRQPQVRECMLRILYCSAIRRPASGYVQGMNDLVAPFLDCFLRDHVSDDGTIQISSSTFSDLEADVFWCVGKLFDYTQNNFTFNQAGLYRQVALFKELVNRADGELSNHLTSLGIEFTQFSFRWFNCFLLREFRLPLAQRIWDTYISEGEQGFNEFHVYVCAALLCRMGPALLRLDFQDAFLLLQNPPTMLWDVRDVDSLLSEAFILKSIFRDTINRLR